MELTFETKALRELCEKQQRAIDNLGDDIAEQLRNRLSDIQSAASLRDLPMVQPIACAETENALFTLPLSRDCLLVFRSNHHDRSDMPDGSLDWSRVSRITLIEVEKTNG